jgi:class 3 adenylate cyclase
MRVGKGGVWNWEKKWCVPMNPQSRVLIVDDNRHNVKILESLLSAQGYEIVVARDGLQALVLAAETPPDLIVMDVMMPNMDGFQTTRILRAQAKCEAIPILMVTALSEIDQKLKGFEAGADDFLSKPFSSVELLARVRSLLRIRRLHDELREKNALLERVLMRYVSEEVARQILDDPYQNLRLGGQACEVSVLFADIRGFTHFSEQRDPALVTEVLNLIFNQLTPAVFEHHGTLDKYLGDAIMAFYGAPVPADDSPAQAVRTAWRMQQSFAELGRENPYVSELGLGIGICTGEAIVGNVGSERVMNYTVIGRTPNMAKRLQECAHAGQILIDERAYQAVKDLVEVRKTEPLELKGYSQLMPVYQVLHVEEPLALECDDAEATAFMDGEWCEDAVQCGALPDVRP